MSLEEDPDLRVTSMEDVDAMQVDVDVGGFYRLLLNHIHTVDGSGFHNEKLQAKRLPRPLRKRMSHRWKTCLVQHHCL